MISHQKHTHTITHTHTQPFNGPLSRTTRVARYQKKHSPTHTHPDHQKSSINFVHLLRSIASSWFNLRASQSFSTGPVWSTPWSGTLYFILHTFLHPIIIFILQHMIGHKKHTKLKRLQANCKPVGECCCQAHTHTHTHTHTCIHRPMHKNKD